MKDRLDSNAVAGAAAEAEKQLAAQLSGTGQRLLAGVPPLSVMLNTAIPVVELEADRLTEAIAWLTTSVQALQRQGVAAFRQMNKLEGMVSEFGALTQNEAEAPLPSKGPLSNADARHLLQHQERNRIAEEKLLGMRIDTLKADIDSRLPAKSLDDIKANVDSRLEFVETKAREDVSLLGSLLHNDFADDRRRLERGFEALQKKSAAQLELVERLVASNDENAREARQKLEERLAKLEAHPGPDELEFSKLPSSRRQRSASRKATLRSEAVIEVADALVGEEGAETTCPRSGQLAEVQERLARLEEMLGDDDCRFGPVGRWSRLHEDTSEPSETTEGARTWTPETHNGTPPLDLDGTSARSKGVPAVEPSLRPAASPSGKELHSLKKRMKRLEEAMGTRSEIGSRLAELQKVQAETAVRLEQLELGGVGSGSGTGGCGVAAAGGGGAPEGLQQRVMERLARFESMFADLESKQNSQERQREKGHKGLEDGLKKVSKSVEALTIYLLKGASGEEDKTTADPFERLQKGMRSSLQTAQGNGLETRLRALEASLGSGMVERLRRLEEDLRQLDVAELRTVKHSITEYRREQTTFNADVGLEVKELKVLVGCLEACVPKETRKAVQLFKRAAGADKMDPSVMMDPQRLELEGRILGVQADVETRLNHAEEKVADQVDHVNAIVKELERKHATLVERIADVSGQLATGARPCAPGGEVGALNRDVTAPPGGFSRQASTPWGATPPGTAGQGAWITHPPASPPSEEAPVASVSAPAAIP